MPDGEVVFDIRITGDGTGEAPGAQAPRRDPDRERGEGEGRGEAAGREADRDPAARAFREFQERLEREEEAEERRRRGDGEVNVGGEVINLKKLNETVRKHNELLGKAGDLIHNPQGAVASRLLAMLSGLGPHGAATVAAISAIIAAPEAAKAILRQLAVKGGPLNRDWERHLNHEVNGALDLRQQKDRQWGLDPLIVAQEAGFEPIDGTDIYNSLYLRDEVRQNRMGQDSQVGGLY